MRPSTVAPAANAQHDPHWPWFSTGGMNGVQSHPFASHAADWLRLRRTGGGGGGTVQSYPDQPSVQSQ